MKHEAGVPVRPLDRRRACPGSAGFVQASFSLTFSLTVNVIDGLFLNPTLGFPRKKDWRRGSESNIILFRSETVATPGRISLCARSSMLASLAKGFPDRKNYFGEGGYYFQFNPQLLQNYYFTGAFTGGCFSAKIIGDSNYALIYCDAAARRQSVGVLIDITLIIDQK